MLGLLGSAGRSKAEIAREARRREAEEKAAREAQKAQRHKDNVEKQARRVAEQREAETARKERRSAGAGATAVADKAAPASFDAAGAAELRSLLEEPSVQELEEGQRAALAQHDALTALPAEGDSLLYAVPVCAPYSALSAYRFRVKLTPGSQKKGKAAKQAVGIFCGGAGGASERERELMRAIKDDELVRQMISNVKLVAPSAATAALKTERKAKAKAKADAKG